MKNRILKYMQENDYITTYDAFTELNCTRLSEYIRQIKSTHIVQDEWIKADKTRYKRYWLED